MMIPDSGLLFGPPCIPDIRSYNWFYMLRLYQ